MQAPIPGWLSLPSTRTSPLSSVLAHNSASHSKFRCNRKQSCLRAWASRAGSPQHPTRPAHLDSSLHFSVKKKARCHLDKIHKVYSYLVIQSISAIVSLIFCHITLSLLPVWSPVFCTPIGAVNALVASLSRSPETPRVELLISGYWMQLFERAMGYLRPVVQRSPGIRVSHDNCCTLSNSRSIPPKVAGVADQVRGSTLPRIALSL